MWIFGATHWKTNHQKSYSIGKGPGPFLFIVSMDDHNWKSEVYAHIASERLQAHGKDRPQIIYYPGTGHCIEPPYFPLCRASVHAVLGQPVFHGVGQALKCTTDAWQQIQTFLP